MILKTLKWLLIAAVVALAGVALVLEVGSRMSLDDNYTYTKETRSLPEFSQQAQDGLVRIAAGAYEFRARVAGFNDPDSAGKPAVILLHGFPVTSAMWNALITPLAEAGYRVIAFDQRGYSPDARPSGSSNYAVDKLVDDVVAVADAAGIEQFHLVGHDWGAVIGWGTVITYPERVLSWSALSIAHPAAFTEALQNDPDQQARSRYFMFFAMPWLPETLFSYDNFKLLKFAYTSMPADARSEYLQMFAEPGALTGALNWYRAMAGGEDNGSGLAVEVAIPTLFIWGNNDVAVARAGIDAQAQYMVGPYEVIEMDAGHWLIEADTKLVLDSLLRHIRFFSAP